MDKKFYFDIPNYVFEFLDKLRKNQLYLYKPSLEGVTEKGDLLSLGYSCYALKIYFMTSEWNKLNEEDKNSWVEFINSFQSNNNKFPSNSYIDPHFLEAYMPL